MKIDWLINLLLKNLHKKTTHSHTKATTALNSKEWHKLLATGKSVRALVEKIKDNRLPEWSKPLLQHSSAADSTLELGSGTGEISAILAIYGRKAHLLDFSEESIEFTKQLFKELKISGYFYVQDVLEGIPMKPNSIDWVWSSGLLEHFSDEELSHIMAESYRVCKKGVMSLVPNANSLFYRISKFRMEQEGTWPYGREIPKFTMRDFFKDTGLKNIVEYSIGIDDSIWLWGSDKKEIMGFFDSLSIEELQKLNQGYLLFTYGEK